MEDLQRQIQERDAKIAFMKDKTKDFIAQLQTGHGNELQAKDMVIDSMAEKEKEYLSQIATLRDQLHSVSSRLANDIAIYEKTIAEQQDELSRKIRLEDEDLILNTTLDTTKRQLNMALLSIKVLEEEKAAWSLAQSSNVSSTESDEAMQTIADFTIRVNTLENEMKTKDQMMKDLVTVHCQLETDYNSRSDLIAGLQLELDASRRVVPRVDFPELSRLETENARLQREITENKELLIDQGKNLDENEEVITGLEAELETLKERLKSNQNKAESDLEKAAIELEVSTKELSTLLPKLVNLQNEKSALQESKTRAEAHLRQVEEEKRLLLETSSSNIISIVDASSNFERELEELKLQLQTSNEDLISYKNEQLEAEQRLHHLRAEVSQKDILLASKSEEIELLQQQVKSYEYEVKNVTGRSDGELIIIKADLQGKIDLLSTIKIENSELTAKLHLSESQRASLETQRAELLRAKEELVSSISSKEDLTSTYQKKWMDMEAELRAQLEQANKNLRQKTQDLNAELDQLQSSLSRKTAEYDMVYAELIALRSSSSSQQSQNASVREEVEKLTQALQAEVSQNQDRKKKVRAYVDNLTVEKAAAEEKARTLEAALAEAHLRKSEVEQHMAVVESRLSNAKEHAALENDRYSKERQHFEISLASSLEEKDGEIAKLKAILDDRSKSTVAEIEQAKQQVVEVSKEAETHKTKRLAARNEMINLVQALEKAQAEADEMQSFFHMKLVPMAYEQVSGIENALMSLETAVGMLSNKKTVKFHSKAQEFLHKRLQAHNGRAGQRRGSDLSVSNHSTRGETESISSRDEVIGLSNSDPKQMQTKSSLGGFTKHVLGSSKPVHVAGINDTMELAHNLHAELDRMRAGVRLLTQSLDRLLETVKLDTKCCGGVYELVIASFRQENIVKRRGYNKVDSDTNLSDEEGDVGLVTAERKSAAKMSSNHGESVQNVFHERSDSASKGDFL